MSGSVVCGVDISESTRSVLDTARWLADGIGARLIVVHAAEEPAAEAEEFVTTVGNRLHEAGSEVRLAEGSAVAALMDTVQAEQAEWLVVGSRGQSSLAAGLFGSVSRGVAADCPVPVVVVPPMAAAVTPGNGEGRSIVCGVDGSEHALDGVRVAARLAQQLGCRLVLVHALHDLKATVSYLGARATNPPLSGQADARDRQAAEIIKEALDSLSGEATGVVEPGSPWDVLESVAVRESSWLVVVAARDRKAMHAALFGSVAARLATAASRPVVMVPDSVAAR